MDLESFQIFYWEHPLPVKPCALVIMDQTVPSSPSRFAHGEYYFTSQFQWDCTQIKILLIRSKGGQICAFVAKHVGFQDRYNVTKNNLKWLYYT